MNRSADEVASWRKRLEACGVRQPLKQGHGEVYRLTDAERRTETYSNWLDGGVDAERRDYWHRYSFGELAASAEPRREVLRGVIPKLKIADRCRFEERFLVVRGDLRTYKIHFGSASILMEPNDEYLCIVPASRNRDGDRVFLPFDGDERLSIILSKALMLAADRRIADPTIVRQIVRGHE